jgi:plasmid stability protein
MKTTLELPDELMRAVKIRAVNEGRRIKDVVADLLAEGLAHPPVPTVQVRHTVRLPLVRCAHAARSGEMTPDAVAALLDAEDAEAAGIRRP